MNEMILNIIIYIHIAFLLFVILVPFIGSTYFTLIHFIIMPFIIIHWLLNDNTCSLTVAEHFIRYKINGVYPDPNDCITYRLIAPIYDFKKNNNDNSKIIYAVAIILWLISAIKLYRKYKEGELDDYIYFYRYYVNKSNRFTQRH